MPQVRRQIKHSELRRLAQLMVTEKEAAGFLGVKVRAFQEMLRIDVGARRAWDEGLEVGKVRIRGIQMDLAAKNPSMAIFLGKQYLGQQDITISEISGRDGGPIKTMDLKRLSDDDLKSLLTLIEKSRPGKESADG